MSVEQQEAHEAQRSRLAATDSAPAGAPLAGLAAAPAGAMPAATSEAPEGEETSGSGEVAKLWEQMRHKDAQLLVLQTKLAHFRHWVASIQHSMATVHPKAVQNSKRVYVGGVPAGTTDQELKDFFNATMLRSGALIAPGPAVLNARIAQHDKGFAFLELRSIEETTNCMAFDGIQFKGHTLKVRRPSNYDPSASAMLGPPVPDPTIDVSGLDICRTVVDDSWSKLFIGGLPAEWDEKEVKELLAPYGALKSFNLVMDKTTGKSKGYAFCEFREDVADHVIAAMNSKTLNKKVLTVKRALEGQRPGQKQHGGAPLGAPQAHLGVQHGGHYGAQQPSTSTSQAGLPGGRGERVSQGSAGGVGRSSQLSASTAPGPSDQGSPGGSNASASSSFQAAGGQMSMAMPPGAGMPFGPPGPLAPHPMFGVDPGMYPMGPPGAGGGGPGDTGYGGRGGMRGGGPPGAFAGQVPPRAMVGSYGGQQGYW